MLLLAGRHVTGSAGFSVLLSAQMTSETCALQAVPPAPAGLGGNPPRKKPEPCVARGPAAREEADPAVPPSSSSAPERESLWFGMRTELVLRGVEAAVQWCLP